VWVGNNEQFAGWLFRLSGAKFSSVQTYPFLHTLVSSGLSRLFTPILLSKESLEGQYKFHSGWRATGKYLGSV